jgi:NAD(P)-dependent dehydrogenase (short-subunit alcohol dehydrogenase family)
VFKSDLLAGKVIVVTGGGTGLGKSMATRFAELGGKVVLASRTLETCEKAAAEIKAATGGEALPLRCDVRSYDECEAMVKATVAAFGKVDALVNNAAGNFLAQTEALSPNGFRAVVDIVLQGTFNATLACGRQMIAQGTGGNLLAIVATYVETGSAYVVPSASAKAGVLAMMRSLAVEWARHKIRANAIAPGPFPTEGAWSRLVPPGMGDQFEVFAKQKIPAGRYGEHRELGDLAAYLLADGSAYVTGECVYIDGGEHLMSGDFNAMIAYDQQALGQLFAAMRPPKK